MDVVTAPGPTAVEISLYAPWSTRFGAWLIDLVLLLSALGLLSAVSDTAGAFAALLLAPVYMTVCHGGRGGQTVGKRAVGVSVRDVSSLGRIGYGRAFLRWGCTFLFWTFMVIPGLVDALWPLGDPKRQALHDKAVGSVVIRL